MMLNFKDVIFCLINAYSLMHWLVTLLWTVHFTVGAPSVCWAGMAKICSVSLEDHRATYWHIVPDSGTLSRVLTANIQLVIISVSVPAVPNTHTCFHNNRLRLAASAQNLPVLSNSLVLVGAFLQATSRVPRWWIGERPPDMAASCDIYK